MSAIRTVDSADVSGKRVLCRVDFNVPVCDGAVGDDTRIRAALPTIEYLLEHDAAVILASHLGRPAGTGFEAEYSLKPVAERLAELLGRPVAFATDTVGTDAHAKVDALKPGSVLLLENLRFDKAEKNDDAAFSAELAGLADVYVNDAFGTAHRAHASTEGVAHLLPAYAGFLLAREVDTLSTMLDEPKRPFVAVLGGSKVSDKIAVIDALIDKCDFLLIGGGMCFTFLAAQGHDVGKSLVETDWIDRTREMLERAEASDCSLYLPTDIMVADRFAADADHRVVEADAIPADMMGLDIGPETARAYATVVEDAASVFWNGPMGVFEMPVFSYGTKMVADAMAACKGDTVIGGGDSVAAVNLFGLADKMSFISTGGGASMELVEGKALPGVEALKAGDAR